MFEVASATFPMLAVLAAGVALINLFPQLSLWLPRWFAGGAPGGGDRPAMRVRASPENAVSRPTNTWMLPRGPRKAAGDAPSSARGSTRASSATVTSSRVENSMADVASTAERGEQRRRIDCGRAR